MEDPGSKYQFMFSLADPTTSKEHGGFRFSNAGKMMALAGFAASASSTATERAVIDFVLSRDSILLTTSKEQLSRTPFYNVGVESQEFKNLAARHSSATSLGKIVCIYLAQYGHWRSANSKTVTGADGLPSVKSRCGIRASVRCIRATAPRSTPGELPPTM